MIDYRRLGGAVVDGVLASWELASQVISSSPASSPVDTVSPVGSCRQSGSSDCAETVRIVVNTAITSAAAATNAKIPGVPLCVPAFM